MKLTWPQIFSWVVMGLLAIFTVGRVYLQPGFPYTHDGENHLARFANYKIALKEGQFPPRLAPNLLNHYTYPVFNYNYPLANILSLPFSALKINYELTFKILALLALISSLIGTDLWLKSLGFKAGSRRWASLVFLSTPYLINLIWWRGNIGEILALSLFPWGLWLTENWVKSQTSKLSWWLVLISSAILLAHNITAMLLVPILLLYGWGRLEGWLSFSTWLSRLKLGLIWLGSLTMCFWFWYPALAEKSAIVLDSLNFAAETSKYFASLNQLIFSPLEFGFAYPGSVDSLSANLGLITWISLSLSGLWLINLLVRRQLEKTDLMIGWFGLISLGLIWLQTSSSQIIWQKFSPLSFLQFPWRLGLPLTILSLPVLTYLIEKFTDFNLKWLKLFMVVILIVQIRPVFQLKAVDYFHRLNRDYEAFAQTTSTSNENLPKNFSYSSFSDWQPSPILATGSGQILVQSWSGTKRNYSLSLQTSSLIIEPSLVFPGFETRANHQLVNYLNSDSIQGRLAYELPAGEYQVTTKFTQHTWPRLIGNSVSLMGWLSFLIWGGVIIRKKNYD